MLCEMTNLNRNSIKFHVKFYLISIETKKKKIY